MHRRISPFDNFDLVHCRIRRTVGPTHFNHSPKCIKFCKTQYCSSFISGYSCRFKQQNFGECVERGKGSSGLAYVSVSAFVCVRERPSVRHADRSKLSCRQAGRQQAGRQSDRPTETDRQTGRQTDRERNRNRNID